MIKVGVIGAGFMALTHIRAYQKIKDVQWAGLCNPSGRNLDGNFNEVARMAGDPNPAQLDMTDVRTSRDAQDMFKDPEIQIVNICTPTSTHVELATAALKAGKHVVLEKPLARTSSEARQIVVAADEASKKGVYLMPAMCIRFWPEYVWLRQNIIQGTYGQVMDARFRRVASAPGWGQQHFLKGGDSGGALLDLHIHDTDFINQCFGRPQSVFAGGYTRLSGAIDHVVALYQYPGGPTVSAEGSWGMTQGYPFNMSYVVNFERATADYDISRGADALRLYVKGVPPTSIKPDGIDGYYGELKYFVDCIRQNRAPETVTARHAMESTEICEAEEESVRTGRLVSLQN